MQGVLDANTNIYADEIHIDRCHNNSSFFVTNIADAWKPLFLKIPNDIYLYDIDEFKVKSQSFEFCVPFNLLMKLVKISCVDSYYCIPIHDSLFFSSCNKYLYEKENIVDNSFPFFCFDPIKFELRSSSKKSFNYELYSRYRYYAPGRIPRISEKNDQSYIIKTYENYYICDGNSDRIFYPLSISGFFIELEKPLDNIDLVTNGIRWLGYDKYIINTYNLLLHHDPGWSRKHSLMLHLSLKNTLPYEIIKLVESYINILPKFFYWFPLELGKIWDNYNPYLSLNLRNDKYAQININPRVNGKIYILGHKNVSCKNKFLRE